jgi:hypothetical protein
VPRTTRALLPLRALLIRAVVLWALLRLVVTGLASIVAAQGGAGPDNPLGVVLLSIVLGYVDLRRRGEAIFWGNLGYSPGFICALFAAVAIAGESVVAVLRG